ncbi:putative papain-like cysteine peptidase superfamily [Plasmopara halstedii]
MEASDAFPGARKKAVPPRLLLQSTLPDADRLIVDPGDAHRRAELKKRRAAIIARRRQRVEDIKAGKYCPDFLLVFSTASLNSLRAEHIAVAKKEADAVYLDILGRSMKTRFAESKLRKMQKEKEEESALSEVLEQQDAEDEESEPSGSQDSDYEDEGAGNAVEYADDRDTDDGEDLRESGDEEDTGDDENNPAGDAGTGDEFEEETCHNSEGSSDDGVSSGVAQKRHRNRTRKMPRKAARTSTATTPRGISDDGDGAFQEGFSRRWSSWEDFHRAFEDFQMANFQQFSGRTSTSVDSRNKQMAGAVAREVEATGKSRDEVEKRKSTQYIPQDWITYCKTLRCTVVGQTGSKSSSVCAPYTQPSDGHPSPVMVEANDCNNAIICLDHHWAAYMVHRRLKICYLFDLLQLKGNYTMLRTSVQLVVESQVGLKDDLTYKEIDWCTQKDGSSCGGWCLAILELLLAERPWRDCLYKVQSYLRLRYLYKAIWIQTSETVQDAD